jgi:hypothetical protein
MAHTPSPWFRESDINDDGSDWILVTKDYELIADLRLDSGLNPVSENEQDANAFLIAAAPEMLSALRAIRDDLRELDSGDVGNGVDGWRHMDATLVDQLISGSFRVAFDAIAKAEGRSE